MYRIPETMNHSLPSFRSSLTVQTSSNETPYGDFRKTEEAESDPVCIPELVTARTFASLSIAGTTLSTHKIHCLVIQSTETMFAGSLVGDCISISAQSRSGCSPFREDAIRVPTP
jgi:hypothetical protein